MMEAINFLVKRGHRNIGLINGPQSMVATQERLEGYMEALKKNKIKIDPNYIFSTDLMAESTHKAMQALLSLKRRPTAVITFNDYVALDAIQFAQKEKIRVNQDICFVSFANLPICHYMENPPLASVEQFPYQQGERAAEILLDLLSKKSDTPTTIFHKVILEPKLEVHQI
jgi:LacI family transcriptional regulator